MPYGFRLFALRLGFAGAGLAGLAAPALAQDATGTWLRDSGLSQVKIAPCGDALCGTVSWVKEAIHKDNIGLKVFFDMKPAAPGTWNGKAFNPEDGKTYTGKMLLEGTTLTTSGCVFGGMICRSVLWTRVK
ncbi:MAG: hypothetical protein JWL62_3334 [Hyphomicrobiales bacterium]|nr:hypothetical protein [Hyphomicrobiales bacterium]